MENNVPPTAEELFRRKQAEMSDNELAELVSEGLSKLCKSGGQSFTMTVPPRVDDFDMLVCELVRRFKEGGRDFNHKI